MNEEFWYKKKQKDKLECKKCYYSDEYGTYIHMFEVNTSVCKCGLERAYTKENKYSGKK